MPATLRIEATLANLAAIREFVSQAVSAHGVAEEGVFSLILAVDEAAANVILHGYQCGPGSLEVEISREGRTLVARVRDNAPPFDPTAVPPPDPSLPVEERALGGMGIYLMGRAMDEIHHRTLPEGGNELTLVKYIH